MPIRRRESPALLAFAMIGVCGLACGVSRAGAGVGGAPEAVGVAAPVDTLKLPNEPVRGGLSFAARRAWVWTEPDGSGRRTRVVLEDAATITVGDVSFRASRADVWIAAEGAGAETRYRVYVYAEEVRTPEAHASLGIRAERLPVTAVVIPDAAVTLQADARFEGPPAEKRFEGLLRDANEALLDIMDPGRRAAPEAVAAPLGPIAPKPGPAKAVEPEPRRRVVLPTPVPGASSTPAPTAPSEPPKDGAAAGGDNAARAAPPARAPRRSAGPAPRPDPGTAGDKPAPAEDDGAAGTPGDAVVDRGEPTTRAEPSGDQPRVDEPAGEPAVGDPPARGVEPGAAAEVGRPIFSASGVLFLSAGETTVVRTEEDATTISLLGDVVVQYEGPEGTLELIAARCVVFLKPGGLRETLTRLSVEDVLGIYLEGGVRATDGSYTMRGERVYYDLQANRAVALDAVFWTYEERVNLPLYLRAEVIRQEADNEFRAERARFANSGFFRPHLGIGARNVTIQRRREEDGTTRSHVDARHVTLRAGPTPFFYFPFFRGDPERIPIRNVGFSDSNRQGYEILSEWDPFTLLGIERPKGLGATLDFDYYEDRGIGLGTRLDWDTAEHEGDLLAYGLPDDRGIDVGVLGSEIEQDGEFRGLLIARDRWAVRRNWTLINEIGAVSDETLTQDLFREIGQRGDDVTTRTHLRRLEGNTALTLTAEATLNDFVVNQHRLQAPGYLVDRLPEIEYAVVAADASPILPPGWLTHTWEAGVASLRLRFSEVTARSQGLRFPSASQRALGTLPDESSGDILRGLGLNEGIVNRFDTRHEVTAPVKLGALRVTPFAVGRFTAYDTDFPEFSPGESDNARFWGSVGTRFSTTFNRVDDTIDSRTFDLHRIRHIVEPSLTLWHAETTVTAADLPVYDDDVEALGEGSAARLAVDQTWQTKRGGPGRWRNVDVLKVTTEYVWAADSAERGTPIGRFYDARPELGSLQQYAGASVAWQASEITSLLGEVIYDPVISQVSRSSAGVLLAPGRGFDAQVGVRRLEAQDATYLDTRLGYDFADKYSVILFGQYNFIFEDFQTFRATVLRDFPVGQLGFSVDYNNITGETSVGFVLRPFGLGDTGSFGLNETPGGVTRSGFGG